MRGIVSIASAVAPVAAIACSPSGSPSGLRKPTRIVLGARGCATSAADGGATLATTSAPHGSPSVAPAAS